MKKLTYLIVLIAWLFSFSVSHATQEGTPSDASPNPNNALFAVSHNMVWDEVALKWKRGYGLDLSKSNSVTASISSIVLTEIVPLSAGKRIKVFHITISNGFLGSNTSIFKYGTGVNCGTGTTTIINGLSLGGSNYPSLTMASSPVPLFTVPAGNALCVINAAASQVVFLVSYIQE